MAFVLHGISPALFGPWFELTDDELAARGARRCVVDSRPGYPCRVSLEDAEVGEEVLLVPFEHHPSTTPYRGTGAIYVRRHARSPVMRDHVPEVLASRMLSLRGYTSDGMMEAAELVDGRQLTGALEEMLVRPEVAYVHVHFARPGCFACRATRAQ